MNQEIVLSIVIPAYKEGENLRLILPRINKVVGKMGIVSEVLVVDTLNKEDDTEIVCRDNSVTYYNRERSNSYGDAIRTGIKYAHGKYVLFMDADGSHDPEFIEKMVTEVVGDKYDVIIASRYVSGGASENPLLLKFMSVLLNTFYAIFLNLKCKDVSNSFKLYHTEQLKSQIGRAHV